jgi:RHS repeat-associated protein
VPPHPQTAQAGTRSRFLDFLQDLVVAEASAHPVTPVPEDLAETPDVRFTQAIVEQAVALGHDAVHIATWVHNTIRFVPTYGSLLGADLCLRRKACNAFDTASLLLALYRVSHIPAHYVRGKMQVPPAQAQAWLGVETPEAALAALAGGGVPATLVTDAAGAVTALQLEHVWVRAYVDYVPSRAEVSHEGDQYVPLDVSFKAVDASGAIVPQAYPILLGTLPYTVIRVIEEVAALPDALRPGATPPAVAITGVVEVGGGQVEVWGTATDTNLVSYQLAYGVAGSGVFIPVAAGTDAVQDGVLGTLDTTVLENGLYTIRLTATDALGNTKTTSITHEVTGQLKLGNFALAFNDLTIPVSGIPITITRTYNSFDKAPGSFGVGWSLAVADVKLREGVNRSVFLTLPNGRRVRFRFTLTPLNWFYAQAGWVGEPGVYDRLEMMGNNQVLYDFFGGTPRGFAEDMTVPYECFEPAGYILTLKNGTRLFIDKEFLGREEHVDPPCGTNFFGPVYGPAKLTKIEDLNGNTVTFTENGIIHSSGKSVIFERDGEGRITTITDPNGNTLAYGYDGNGDLVTFAGQETHTTRYIYDDRHNLIDIIDPRGVRAIRTEYDENGRMVATIDAEGNRIELTHDMDNKQEIVRDRLGHPTIYEYDDKGNVVSETNALGHKRTYTYDVNGNRLTWTDPLGRTTNFTYDSRNNMLTGTDPLGNKTTYTYNARNQVLTETDPQGSITAKTYDAKGNLLTETGPLGNVTTYTYDSKGNRTSKTNCQGNKTIYVHDAFGNKIKETDPLGNVTTYTYDPNGNELTKTTTRTTDSGSVTMITTKEYDSLGQLIKATDSDGSVIFVEYNSIRKRSATVDKNGNRTSYEYDAAGNLIRTTYPDGTTETNTYDAEKNRLASTDRAGRTTQYKYDALNRLVRTIYPDGSITNRDYDATDRVTADVDENGNKTAYEYDAVGRRTKVTDALGNITRFTYDANGNRTSMIDANGNTTSYVYDALNRRVRTIFPDATFTTMAYAACCESSACNERLTSETDQAGNMTSSEYDILGRLTKVINAIGGQTTYAYDEIGNKITQTDPNGNISKWAYDNLGRVLKHTLPLGMSETFTYDGNGNIISKTDFNGSTTTYVYDASNRLIKKSYHDSSAVSFTYTATGQRQTVTDSRGVTSYSYDLRDRLVNVTNPDGTEISYAYDAKGNRTSVTVPSGITTFTYDVMNRLKTVTDPDGGETTYAYDSVGNRSSITYPNGTSAKYTYDALNRLTKLENLRSDLSIVSSYEYTLGPAGNRIKVTENRGRVVDYTYDDLYRLTEEKITDAVLGNQTISYTYDPVGNRLTKTDPGGTTNNIYDANDRLINEGDIIYTYDNNGNTVSTTDGVDTSTYSYDYENRLIFAQTPISEIDYEYDVDDIRVSSTVNGIVTKYLVDKNREYAQVLQETDEIGTLIVRYVYGDDLISQHRNGTATYYHYDGQISTRKLTNASEAITDSYVYDAFGVLINRLGTTANNYLYAGEQYDPNVGFYYLRARYYNPSVGRFMTMDTVAGSIFEPKTLHKYLYAGNDPVNNIDPSGQFTIAEQMAVVTIMSVASYYTVYFATGKWKLSAIVALVIFSAGTVYVALPATISALAGPASTTVAFTHEAAVRFSNQIIARFTDLVRLGRSWDKTIIEQVESLIATPKGRYVLQIMYENLSLNILRLKNRVPDAILQSWESLATKIYIMMQHVQPGVLRYYEYWPEQW